MSLTVAIAFILVELGAGILLFLPLVPISEVKRSFFTFHSILAAICFALAAGVHHWELHSPGIAAGLATAALLCVAGFGAVRLARLTAVRVLHASAGWIAIGFGLVAPVLLAGPGTLAGGAGLLHGLWVLNLVLGAVLLGVTHDAMGLGHWYLISRNLSFAYLIRLTKILLGVLVLRAVFMVVVLVVLTRLDSSMGQPYLSQLFSLNGNLMFFVMRVLWGLGLPFVLAFMAWRCAVGKANQAATGLLYLCEVSVLFGELFAAYLMI